MSLNTKEREQLALLDKIFPGGAENFRGTEKPRHGDKTADIASVREGKADLEDLPWMLHENRGHARRMLNNYRENAYDRSNPQHVKEFASLLKAVAADTMAGEGRESKASRELASYREFELTNWVMATPFALSAFQAVNLSADELPLIKRPRTRNLQRFTVRAMGQDGGARMDQWRTTLSAETLEMEMIATDRIQYPLIDLQQGNVNQLDYIQTELTYDMEMKIDVMALAAIDASKTTSGLRDLLSVAPLIDPLNIPDKNYLDLSGSDPGVLTIAKMKTILNHLALFGAVGDAEHAVRIQTIMLSPQNLRDSWDFVSLVMNSFNGTTDVKPINTVPSAVRDSIYQTGMFTSAWGYNWNWTPNGRISKGRMYVFTDKPLGWMFTKSEFDKVIEWKDDPDHIEQNMGEIMYRRALTFVVPDLWKYRILIIDL